MHPETQPPAVQQPGDRTASGAVTRRRLLAGGAIGAAGAATIGPRVASATGGLPGFISLLEPARLFDSRRPDDILSGAKLDAGGVVSVLTVAPGVEYEPETVFVNLTVTDTEGFGYLAVRGSDFRDGVTAPETSNINWSGPGITIANLAVSRVGAENSIDIFCEGVGARTHLIVDLQAYVPLDLSAFE